jgi:hypothetical protein|tara:strand:- start:432 stop:3251 length:2820 start_codon:yes stop_codon:yes gene_type:complete
MTINSTTRKTSNLVGNGNTATYPFAFKVFTDADVVVKKLEVSTSIETTLTLGANNDYIVTLNEDQNSNPGGSITLKSGGNNQNLASGFQLVITSAVEPLQGTDLTNQGGFFPEVINDALDKAIVLHQQQQDELNRSIKFSLTNTIGSLEITENANARKNRVLGFDNLGEFEVLKELGTYRGNWAASTAYAVRDLVKDTSTGNIFFCNTAHTSSGSQPLTTNTNSANWDLIVDAATATTASNNAASSATAAANSATAAANSATAAATSETNAGNSATTATTKASQADTAKTAAETAKTAAETAKTAAEAALDSFDDRYLGAKASNPTLDNDGNALIDGALYFNTTSNIMRVYDLGNTTWLDVNISGTNLTNTNTVAGAISNVNAVGGSIANVNTVASNISDVNTVAADIAKVVTVANDLNETVSEIETAAADLQETTSEIDTVANAIGNVDNVGNNIANVNTVAGISTEVSAVANNAANVNAVGGAITNVNNVGGSIANVNTVASNISGINDFAARYRVGPNNPSTNNDDGDLFYNTSLDKLLVYNATASAWEETQTIGSFFINTISQFSGTGGNSATFNNSAYKFNLSNAGAFAQQMIVSINGVVQKPNAGTSQPSEGFALDGATIIFAAPPPAGADYFIVTIGATVGIGTPSAGTVTEASLNVSNNPVNGYFLQYKDNTDQLTWAEAVNFTTLTEDNSTGDLTIEGTDTDSSGSVTDDDRTKYDKSLNTFNLGKSVIVNIGFGKLSTKLAATTAVQSGLTGYVLQNSLKLEASANDIWLATSGKKITIASSDSLTHEVARFQTSALGASQHGYVDLNYVTANAGGSTSSANRLKTTLTGITLTGVIVPAADSTHDLGTNAVRWRNIYADTLYGDGSNLTGIQAGAAGNSENIFHENENTMDNDYTIGNGASNINAGVFGPLTINATLNIPATSVLTIV